MWNTLFSKKRYYGQGRTDEDRHEEPYRSSFHRDYDRLIFSYAFRRLSRKTQVHPLAKNDHVHNRLTHSLEVASVGRTLGLKAGEILQRKVDESINPYDIAYIVQTACLAHDIGNPPFGHAGEEVIKEWIIKNRNQEYLSSLTENELNDFIHLDGNAQSFRIVSQLENNLFAGGLNLTFATLGTLVKYPYPSFECTGKGKSKFSFFQSETDIFELVFKELGLKIGPGKYKRHPLSFLMEASDDICYGLLDLQDAIELNIISKEEVIPVFNLICGEKKTHSTLFNDAQSDTRNVSRMVAVSINELAMHTMEVFENQLDRLTGSGQPSELIELFTKEHLKQGIKAAKELGKNRIFNNRKKIKLELGAFHIIETILSNLIPATYELYKKDEDSLSFRNRRALELMGHDKPEKMDSLYPMYQRVIDYLVGMTDNYAKHIAGQLKGSDE